MPNQFRDFWLFICALGREWVVLLTGGAIIASLELWALTDHVLNQKLAWLIVGLTFILAAFGAWRREYAAKEEAEKELKSESDMRGDIWVTILQFNPLQDQTRDGSGLRFTCDCANHGRHPCEISRVCLLLSWPDFPQPIRFDQHLLPPNVRLVGYGQEFRLDGGSFILQGIRQSRLRKASIVIHLIDSLGVEYQDTVTKIDRAEEG